MSDVYEVSGGVAGKIPGLIGPAGVDGRIEWVPVVRDHADLLERLEARLGSEVDLHKIVLGVLAPLCPVLDGAPLEAVVRQLPQSLGRELAWPDFALSTRVRPPRGAGDYLVEVGRLILQPPDRALTYVRALFAAARAVMPRGEAEAIAARLPAEIAEVWRGAG